MRLSKTINPDHELNFVALTGGTETEVKGKRTMPSQRVFDPDFQYQSACKTNLAETFKRVRASMNGVME